MTLTATYPGLRVLDLSTNIAGPFAAMILGDMGADVTKIDRAPGGDDTRTLPPQRDGQSTIFAAVNRNKRSIVVDLKDAAGRAALIDMVRNADVVIESFPPGVGEKLGLTHAAFSAANPVIITCSISAFGDGTLGAAMPGYDALVQAVSGLMSFTGNAGEPPVRMAPSVLDLSTGMWAAMGIMAALARRSQNGAGEHVRTCLLDTAFNLMNHQMLGFLATGLLPEKLGTGAPSAAPYGVYSATDGDIMIATASEPQWPRLRSALNLDDVVADHRFADMAARVAHRDELDQIIAAVIRTRSVSDWLEILSAAGISAGRLNSLAEALALPVVQERGLIVELAGQPLIRLPIDPDGSAIRMSAPRLGEHKAN